jgi:hypothetical protein
MLSTNRKRPWQGVIGDRCTNITDRAAGFQRREGSRSVCSRSPRPPLLKSENTPGGGTRLHGARGRAPSPIEPASEPGDSSAREGSRPRDPFVREAHGLPCSKAKIHQAIAPVFTARGDARPPQSNPHPSRVIPAPGGIASSRSVCSRNPRPPLRKSENTPGDGTRLHGARGRAPSPIEPASEPGDSSAGRDRVLAIRLFAKPAASLAQKRKYTRL